MKNIYRKWLATALLALASISAKAYDFEAGGIYYNTLSSNTCEVTSGDTKYTGEVTIPETVTYDGQTLTVTSIGKYAFQNCTSLTGITIPNSVASIGYAAFEGCTSLAEITIPNSVTSIGISAFRYCTSLTEITIGESVTEIGDSAFYGCTSLTEVIIPNSVTLIGNYAFSYCTSLEEVTIGESVTSIGLSAFSGDENITAIYSLNPEPPTCEDSDCFESSVYANATLYVPESSLEAYQEADVWKEFLNTQEMDYTGISGVAAEAQATVRTGNGCIAVDGASGLVSVYDLSGTMISSVRAEGSVEIAVPRGGVYIVKVNGQAVKVAM